VPDALRLVEQEWLPQFREWVVALGVVNHQNFDMAVGRFNAAEELTDHLKSAISTLWDSVPQVFSTLIHLILIPVLTFFFLKNFHKIRTFVLQIVPQDIKQPLKVLVLNTHITLHSIVKGQATVAGVLAILYVIGFSVIGLPSAFSIGLIAGICRFIPYLDVLVGGILAFIVILSDFSGWYQILSVIVVFVIVQSVDGLLITPRIVGERAGLHPLVVILSILTFAEIWGFWGVVIAIPTVALVRVIWQLVLPYYFASRLYRP
jgi:predicted PurR-regulated permease PerM